MNLTKQFQEYDQNNPHVWHLFKRFAKEALDAGHKVLSASLIVERIRWEVNVVTYSNDPFKVNNNHRAFYSRKFMTEHPEYGNVFRTRTQHAA